MAMVAALRFVARWGMLLALGLNFVSPAAGIGFEAFGPAGEHIGRSDDWPSGVEDVLRHGSRVYSQDVNGYETAYYDGDVAVINELLEVFARVGSTEHLVVLRPGRPEAKSFQDKFTPYAVKFEAPGGLYLFDARRQGRTGLYNAEPRLTVHIDAKMAERMGELRFPANVTLAPASVRLEDAVAHAFDENSSLRWLAVTALVEIADKSPASVAALNRAASDDNERLRALGERGLAQLVAAEDAPEEVLRRQVLEFVANHPQRQRVVTPKDLLEKLQAVDAAYAQGFTVRGTRVEPVGRGPWRLIEWTLTMGEKRLVVDQHDLVDDAHPPVEGRVEYVIYAGPTRMGSLQKSRLWADGKLIDTQPFASFEPVGSTYDILIGRTLWALGRGYSGRLAAIEMVTPAGGGLIAVTAWEGEIGASERWELIVDPAADFLVTNAKLYYRNQAEPEMTVETAGIMTGGGRSVAHTARWIEGAEGAPASIAVTSVSAAADAELIAETERELDAAARRGQP
jgi:hypothetical protein